MTAAKMTAHTIDVLTLKGYVVWRNNAGKARRNMMLAPAGTPDIIGYAPDGTFVGVEIKAGRDKLRDSQRKWLEHADCCGCYTMVVYSAEDIAEMSETWR